MTQLVRLQDGMRDSGSSLEEAKSSNLALGQYVRITDLDYALAKVETEGVADDASVFAMANGNFLIIQRESSAKVSGPGLEFKNVILGSSGDDFTVPPTINRAAWDAITGPSPTVANNSLSLDGNYVGDVDSAIVLGGRPSYYSAVDGKASLSLTYGGDNYNGHLAGVTVAFHCDLIDDDLGNGDHGCVVGGSYKIVSGSYGGSFAGQVHECHGLQSVILGGRNIKIGSKESAIVARRSAALGGFSNHLKSGYQSAIVGGESNVIELSDNSVLIGSDTASIKNSLNSFVAGSSDSIIDGGSNSGLICAKNAVNDKGNSYVSSSGKFLEDGDSQTYNITARRKASNTVNVFLSVTGGSGSDIHTPDINETGILTMDVVISRTDIDKMATFQIQAAYSNIGGSLVVKGQTTVTGFADDPLMTCTASVVGGGTRVGVKVDTNSDLGEFIATATGKITVNKVR